ncbi:MAG: PilN domain-containing protein [bacterium]|nr:PilN domain-containing protein [bacterium]
MLPGGRLSVTGKDKQLVVVLKAMPKKDINLLPREDFEKQPIGKILMWSLSVGRWIVIGVELIVIIAFISRFWLDRELSDLHESIRTKQGIIQSQAAFEKDFISFQQRLASAEQISNGQTGTNKIIAAVASATPQDVALKDLTLERKEIKFTGLALSETGLKSFTAGLANTNLFKDINVVSAGKQEGETNAFKFTISAIVQPKDKK